MTVNCIISDDRSVKREICKIIKSGFSRKCYNVIRVVI